MLRLTTLTALLALSACADQGDEGFIVLNNSAVKADCAFDGSKSQPFIPHGQIYAGSHLGYLVSPLLESRITMVGDVPDTSRTIYITGANVELSVKAVSIEHADGTFSSGSTFTLPTAEAKFSALVSASLPPAGTANVSFEAIPVATLRDIAAKSGAGAGEFFAAEILATITVLGKYGEDKIAAAPFAFPISVCTDCVVVDHGACPMMGTIRGGNACNPLQDGVVDCCDDAVTGKLVCPATM